ncbi:MAG: protein jag [Candidatus Acidiferrales bacterium]
MPDPRPSSRNRRPGPDRPAGDARLDAAAAAAALRHFLDIAVREMHLNLSCEISQPPAAGGAPGETDVMVAFSGEDQELLLERNAELLLALEHIAHRCLRLDPRLHDRVRFDCGDYRALRLDELKLSARVAAQRVRETGQPHRFNLMSSRERRLIHLELTGAEGVRTESEGSGEHRQLVIYPTTKNNLKR